MVALTKGQIETFGLIALKQIACQYGAYLEQVENGLISQEQEERFYKANSMWDTIWGYNPFAPNNCLTDEQIYYICMKLMDVLCFSLVLENLPETYLNGGAQLFTEDGLPIYSEGLIPIVAE